MVRNKNFNSDSFTTKIEKAVKEIYERAIPSYKKSPIKEVRWVFDIFTRIYQNKIFIDHGSKLFFEEHTLSIGPIEIKVSTKESMNYRYQLLNDRKWRDIKDDNLKLKMVHFYDRAIRDHQNIDFDQLKIICTTTGSIDELLYKYEIDVRLADVKAEGDELKKLLKPNYQKWKAKKDDEIIEMINIYKTLYAESFRNIKYDDIELLFNKMRDVNRLIIDYKLYIGEKGYTSGKYKPMTTRLALARGLDRYSSSEDGVLKNNSDRNVFFLGNERDGVHGAFEGVVRYGEKTPRGVDVDFVYWRGKFYKVLPDIIATLYSKLKKHLQQIDLLFQQLV